MSNDINTSYIQRIITLSEGNPGAITVLSRLFKLNYLTLNKLEMLEKNDIRGSKIWIKYKEINIDVTTNIFIDTEEACNKNTENFVSYLDTLE